MDSHIQHTLPCIHLIHTLCADGRFHCVHIQIDKYRLDICQQILVFHPLQNTRIGDLAMHDTMSALFVILPVRRFRSCLNDHIHGTIAYTVYRRLHLMPVKKSKQIVKLILTECDDPGIFRRILVRLIHGRCSCTKGTILDQLHRSNSKVISPLPVRYPSSIKAFASSTCSKALLIMADTQLSSGIQCLVGHDPTPVFFPEGGKDHRTVPVNPHSFSFFTVLYVAFHFFLGWCFQYGRIKTVLHILSEVRYPDQPPFSISGNSPGFFRSSRPQLLHTATCPQTRTIMMGISVESASSSSLCG